MRRVKFWAESAAANASTILQLCANAKTEVLWWFSLTISPVTDDSGEIIGASKIVHPLRANGMIEQHIRSVLTDVCFRG
jgi:hypothetical protein